MTRPPVAWGDRCADAPAPVPVQFGTETRSLKVGIGCCTPPMRKPNINGTQLVVWGLGPVSRKNESAAIFGAGVDTRLEKLQMMIQPCPCQL